LSGRIVLAAVLVLSGCVANSVGQALYPGAQSFSYAAAATGSTNTYACAPTGPGGATPQLRAQAMHRFFETESGRFADAQVAEMMKTAGSATEAQMQAGGARLDAATNAFADRMFKEGDTRFKCVLAATDS
jgi:hypothetical protein